MRCPYCQTDNQDYAPFCLGCGETLIAQAAPAVESKPLYAPPQPSSVVRRPSAFAGRGWEKWIGLGLVLVLLVIGTGDWLRRQAQAETYRAGRAAEAAQHWDTAVAAYGHAAGYEDSVARRQAAAGQIAQRDRLYAQGLAAAATADWTTARTAWEGASRIQPDYADLPDRLAEARYEVTATVAAGLIFRQAPAGVARLVVQGPLDRPVALLPNSDGASAVRGFAPDGSAVVYDGPQAAGGRRLYLALLAPPSGTALVRESRVLPAGLALDGHGVFCSGGLWWITADGTNLRYYDLRTTQVTSFLVSTGRRLLGEDAAHGWLLLAEPYTAAAGPRSRLLLTAADGANARLVVDSPGSIRSAELSPDGRWLVYEREEVGALVASSYDSGTRLIGYSWEPNRADATTTSLMLAGVAGPNTARSQAPGGAKLTTERMLDHVVAPDDQPLDGGIVAHFAPGAPATLVANRSDRDGRTVTIYEAATGIEMTFRPAAPLSGNRQGPFFSPRGTYLLVEEAQPPGVRLSLQPLGAPARDASHMVQVPVGHNGQVLGQVTLRDDYLLYLVVDTSSWGIPREWTLYSLPLAAGPPAPAAVPLVQSPPGASLAARPGFILAPAGTLLIYLQPDGTLLGLPLDGSSPIRLAADVSAVWSPQP